MEKRIARRNCGGRSLCLVAGLLIGKDMDGGGAMDPERAADPAAVRWANVTPVARDIHDFLNRLAVEAAVTEGDVTAIEAYLRAGHDVNATVLTSTLLSDAIFAENVELIRWLYAHGADGTSAGNSWYFAMDNRRETFDAFLEGVKDVNAFGRDGWCDSLLFTALLKDQLDLAREILRRGARITEEVRGLAASQAAKGNGAIQALLDEWQATRGQP
jgi:hypothetical protein